MNTELEILTLGKSELNNNSTKNNTKSIKKEGMSLFDSLLVDNKRNTEKIEKKDAKNIKTKDFKNTEIKILESNSTKIKPTDESKSSTENKIEVKENKSDSKAEKQSTSTKEIKVSETKVEQKTTTSSLLDKMILEAKITIQSSSENKNINKNKENNEEKSGKNILTSNVKQDSSSSTLLDKMILEAKKSIDNKTTTSLEKNTLKNEIKITKSDNDESKVEIKQNTSSISLLDKMIENAKVIIKSETKEVTHKKTNESDLVDNKKEVKNKKTNEIDIVNNKKEILKSETKEVPENKINKKTKIDVVKNEVKDILVEQNNKNNKKDETGIDSKDKVTKKTTINIDNNIKVEDNSESISKTSISETINIEKKEVIKSVSTISDVKDDNKKNIKLDTSTKNETINLKVDEKSDKSSVIDTPIKKEVEKSDKVVSSNILNDNTKNDKTSKKLSNIDQKTIVKNNETIDIDKTILEKSSKEVQKSNSKSLMDRLIDNAKTATVTTKDDTLENKAPSNVGTSAKSNDIVTNIFLGSQKNSIYNQMLSNKSEGVKVVKEAKSINDVKKGANILDLEAKDASINVEKPKNDIKINNQNNDAFLDRLAFSKNIKREDITSNIPIVSSNSSSTASSETVVNLNVSATTALSIQNRIIGAQQQMSSFMSDVARDMYRNYKPPVTAFRIKLFPSTLGSIAILMKSDKENGISISMNMSSSSTLDTFVENQASLRDALNKNFNNNDTNFNLEFNMQDQNFNQQSSDDKDEKKKENSSTNDILESINQNQDVGDDLNYM